MAKSSEHCPVLRTGIGRVSSRRVSRLMAGCISVLLLFVVSGAYSQTAADGDLRKEVQNPVGQLISVSITDSVSFNAGGYGRNSNAFQIQPVIPIQISEDWLLVSRILVNGVLLQPDPTRNSGGVIGFGDTNPAFFFSPARSGRLVWGIGPTLSMPTSSNSALGPRKWILGPALAVFTQPHWGTVGVIVQNGWSLGGNANGGSINVMSLQVSGQYNLPHDWYLSTQPEIAADWNEPSGNRWLVPVGGGVGKVFSVGKQSLDGALLFYVNAIRPGTVPFPKWQLSLQLGLLFPKKK